MDNNQFNNQQNNQYNQYNQQNYQQNSQYNPQYNQQMNSQYSQQYPNQNQMQQYQNPQPKNSKGIILPLVIGLGAGVVVIAIIFAVMFFMNKDDSDYDYARNDKVTTEDKTTEATSEKTTEATTEATTKATTEATTTEATTEASTEASTEAVVEVDGTKIGSDEVGYLTTTAELTETDEFDADFQSASYVKGYKDSDEDFLIGLVRYDTYTKTPEQMAEELNESLSARSDTSTALSSATIGKNMDISCQKLLSITENGVYAGFYFFEKDGHLYVIQIVYSIMHFVEAETITYTYEIP